MPSTGIIHYHPASQNIKWFWNPAIQNGFDFSVSAVGTFKLLTEVSEKKKVRLGVFFFRIIYGFTKVLGRLTSRDKKDSGDK